jgi:hypothetical protein
MTTHSGLIQSIAEKVIQPCRRAPDTSELEVSLGARDSTGRYTAGVSKDYAERVLEALRAGGEWDQVHDWKLMTDIWFGTEGIRDTRRPGQPGAVRCSKTRIGWVDTSLQGPMSVYVGTCTPIAARITAKKEIILPTPEPDTSLPEAIVEEITMVRKKLRKSYVRGSFQYDVTMVWSGSTIEMVEAMDTSMATYEVEIECICLSDYLDTHSNQYVAESLLLKVQDLVPGASARPMYTHKI